MFDITQYFKPQSSDKNQENNTTQDNSSELSAYEKEQLELSRQSLEIQRQEASMNPDYQLERDAERLLNPETILSKKGMPVQVDPQTGMSFVPSDVLNHVTENYIKKPLQELEQRAKSAEEQVSQLQEKAYRDPKIAEYLNRTYPALADSTNVTVEELIPYLVNPQVQKLLEVDEEKAILRAIQYLQNDKEIERDIARNTALSQKQTYSDGSEIPSSVAGKMYDQYMEINENPHKQYLGRQVLFVIPDNSKQGDPLVDQALRHAGRIGMELGEVTKNNPKLQPIVRVVKESELKSQINELEAHPSFKVDEYGNPTSLTIDKRFLQRA